MGLRSWISNYRFYLKSCKLVTAINDLVKIRYYTLCTNYTSMSSKFDFKSEAWTCSYKHRVRRLYPETIF